MTSSYPWKGDSQDPEFQKKYLKLIDEEPTPVMPITDCVKTQSEPFD
jgi:hypothetical protein